jgi:hypothetical protein
MVLFPGCSCCGPCTHCAVNCLRATFADWFVAGGGLDLLTRIDGAAFTLVRGGTGPETIGGHTFAAGCVYQSDEVCGWIPGPGIGVFSFGGPLWAPLYVRVVLAIDSTHVGVKVLKRQIANGAGHTTSIAILDVAFERSEADHRHDCTDLVFTAEDTSGGTITIAEGDCEEPSHGPPCTMPESITLALAGMGDVVSYRPVSAEDTICDDSAVIYNLGYMGLGSTPPGGYLQGKLTEDGEAVLDRVSGACAPWTYAGVLPVPMCPETWPEGLDARYTTPRPVTVTIQPIDAGTTVVVDAPTRGGTTATAQVSGIDAAGTITGITRLTGGSGYAVRRVDIVEPVVTAAVAGGTTAPTLAVTMAPRDDVDPPRWAVASVAVTAGGTGHDDTEEVVFSTADHEEWPAFAEALSGRESPAITCVVDGTGTGAEISAQLEEAIDSRGRSYWRLLDIDFDVRGTGYTEGDPITFTLLEGTEQLAAVFTVTVDEDGVITGVNAVQVGEYYKSTGVIVAVWVGWDPEVETPDGSYWREELTEIVDSDTPTVAILSPTGSGASATATVDTTIGSGTFGQITGFTLGAGGTEYMAGDAWLLTATIDAGPAAAFRHLDCTRCDTAACRPGCVPLDYYGTFFNPFAGDCAASVSRLQPIANRVSKQTCPTELIDRDYPLYLQSGIRWLHKYEGVATYCSPGGAIGDPPEHVDGVTVFEFAAGTPIKATVAPT